MEQEIWYRDPGPRSRAACGKLIILLLSDFPAATARLHVRNIRASNPAKYVNIAADLDGFVGYITQPLVKPRPTCGALEDDRINATTTRPG